MFDHDDVGHEPLRPEIFDVLQARVAGRLSARSAIALSVPPGLQCQVRDGWPWYVIAARFENWEPPAQVGVWLTDDCSIEDGEAVLAPVVPVNGPAVRWSTWGRDLHPSGPFRTTTDQIISSGPVAYAIETCVGHLERHP